VDSCQTIVYGVQEYITHVLQNALEYYWLAISTGPGSKSANSLGKRRKTVKVAKYL